ncbi:MAG TPA: M20/M25/M40 family metallo-hydrolase [Clostridia bacterium]|nr:M20/M25/M40 family metallo-hydrolase [Clostridia bacterium]
MKKKYVLNENSAIERFFEEVSRIPRESGNEKDISDYLVAFAEEHRLWWYRDDICNVVIKKPASVGREESKAIMLQAHTDMVCTKTRDSDHDFLTDPIELYLNNGMLKAKKTSLGADDGWGVAYMLAILSDDTLEHPALECVFTSQEETTNGGAKNIDISKIEARRMISLDGDEEYSTYVSCFTSERLIFEKKFEMVPAIGKTMRVKVSDMSTNVYGGLLHQEAGNAIKIIARLLESVVQSGEKICLYDYTGGSGENFGPEVCTAAFCYEGDEKEITATIKKAFDELNSEFDNEDYRGNLSISTEDKPEKSASAEDTEKVINLVYLVPNNLFQSKVTDMELIAVNNIGLAKFKSGAFKLVGCVRSGYITAEAEVITHCRMLAIMTGFSLETAVRYSGWPYDNNSKMRAVANEVLNEMYGHTFEEVTCPGGLEIAHFVNRIDGMDAIELGVNHFNPHAVEETMDMGSFRKMYDVIKGILAKVE